MNSCEGNKSKNMHPPFRRFNFPNESNTKAKFSIDNHAK